MNKGIEKGIERGIKLGSKSAAILTQIKLSIHLMQKGTDLALFLDVFDELNEKTIELLKLNVQQEFKTLAFQEALATHLMITFEYLLEEDIAKICQLKLEDVQAIKDSIAKKAK